MAEQSAIDRAVIERLDRLGGKKLVLGMIDIFLEHAPTRVAAARAGLSGSNFDEIRHAAHSLKSSAGNLGAPQLQAVCETIERTVEKNQTENMTSLVGQMGSETDAARNELAEIRKLYE